MGNKTECTFLGLITDLKQDDSYNAVCIKMPEQKFYTVYTFNSAHKSTGTVTQKPDSASHVQQGHLRDHPSQV